MQLDQVDISILSFLQNNARIPFTKIAQKLGISDATIHIRVKKMEDIGLIEKYNIVLNEEKIGNPITAYVLLRINPGSVEKVCRNLMKLDEVYEISEIHEHYDVLVKIRGSSLEETRNILIQKIRSIPEIVGSDTLAVFKTWKRDLGMNVQYLTRNKM